MRDELVRRIGFTRLGWRNGLALFLSIAWLYLLGSSVPPYNPCGGEARLDANHDGMAFFPALCFLLQAGFGARWSWTWLVAACSMGTLGLLMDVAGILGAYCAASPRPYGWVRGMEMLGLAPVALAPYALLVLAVRPGPRNILVCAWRGVRLAWLAVWSEQAYAPPDPEPEPPHDWRRSCLPVVIFYWMFLFGWAYPPLVDGALTRDPQFYLAALLPSLALLAHLIFFTRASWWGVVGSLLPACLIQVATRLHYVQPFAESSFRVQEARLIPVLFLIFLALALLIRPRRDGGERGSPV